MDLTLSEGEKRYIINGVKMGLRVDGRDRLDYRQVEIETGLVSTANGSSRVRLARTDVLVTVKMEIERPEPAFPTHGKLGFFVNCSANAAPEFEGRGGDGLSTCLSGMLDKLYSSPKCFDKCRLCVVAGKHVKAFYVDVEILECGGNLFDVVSLGVKAALFSVRTPRIEVRGEDGGEMEFSVSDNPNDVDRIDVTQAPILITHLRISENVTVVDPTLEEECCGPMRVVVGVTPRGRITAAQILGAGSIAPTTLINELKSAKELGVRIQEKLLQKLEDEESISERRIRGFLSV